MPIRIDREIKSRRPDITVKNVKNRTDMAIPAEVNTSVKVDGKLSESTMTWRLKS